MGTLVSIRFVGEDSLGLARLLDMAPIFIGTAPDSQLESCGDWTLFRSYLVYFNE